MAFRLSTLLPTKLPKLPLSGILMVPLVLQLVGTVGLTGYLSYRNGQRSISELSHQLLEQSMYRVGDHLDHFLGAQQRAIATSQQAIQQGEIQLESSEALQRHLWQQMVLLPNLGGALFVDEQGREVGYVRLRSQDTLNRVEKTTGKRLSAGVALLSITNPKDSGKRNYYLVDDRGQPHQPLYSFKIDTRTTPWYQSGKASQGQSWSPIVVYRVIPDMGIVAHVPVHDRAGRFQGIFVSMLTLSEISTFLSKLDFSPTGQAFILDRTGQLVATSTLETPFTGIQDRQTRLAAINSQSPVTKLVAERLRQQWPDLMALKGQHFLEIQSPQGMLFVRVVAYQDEYGLDWLLVGVVPEVDFASHIQANNRNTALICLVAAIVTSGISWLLAQWIAKPLQRLNADVNRLAQGDFETPLANTSIREVENLAESFRRMAHQLQISITSLEQQSSDLAGVFNTFFQFSTVGMAIVDDHYRFVQINELLAQFNARPVEEHLGRTIWEAVPHLAPVIEPLFRQVFTTGQPILSREMGVEDANNPGLRRYRLVSYFPLLGEDGQPSQVGVVVIDITDRRRAELALKASEQYNRAVLEAIPDLIIRIDRAGYNRGYIRTNQMIDLVPSYVNPIGLNISEYLSPEQTVRQMAAIEEVLETGRMKVYEQQQVFPDRIQYEEVRIVAHTQDEVLLLIRDITHRKLAEEKLRRSEMALLEAQRIAHLGSWEFDLTTQKITWSQELFRIYGVDPNQPEPTFPELLTFLPPDTAEQLNALVERAITEGAAYELEYQFQRPDGTFGWIMARGEAQRNEQGTVVKLLGACQDITDRKQVELELQQAKEAAEAANKAKSIFLANMSHELRTPLNAILGFAQLMGYDASLSQQQQGYLTIIKRSGDHLLDLINDVLDMSKIEAGRITLETKVVNLIALLQTLRDMFQQRALSKDLQFILEIAPEVPKFVTIDDGKLRQILVNLLGNAIKFTSQGRITFRVFCSDGSSQDSVMLHLAVEDTGIGIAKTDMDYIFEAFAQAQAGKETTEGTGLGLAISRRLASLMAGELSVNSVPNQGSVFTVTLPVQVAPAPRSQEMPRLGSVVGLAPGTLPQRILVVDDQPDNRHFLMETLTRLGLMVKSANDGQEALALWRSWHPHLIWMDLRMPNLNGYETTQRIRNEEMKAGSIGVVRFGDKEAGANQVMPTKIIALTAQAFQDDRDRALAAGCDDFVTKPVQEKTLLTVMAKQLGLNYVYADAPDPTEKTMNQPTHELSPATRIQLRSIDLRVMPPEWIHALHQATIACYTDKIEALLAQIPDTHQALADELRRLSYDYEYEVILELTATAT